LRSAGSNGETVGPFLNLLAGTAGAPTSTLDPDGLAEATRISTAKNPLAPEPREDQAWEITRAMAELWGEESWMMILTIPIHFRLGVSGDMSRLASRSMYVVAWVEVTRRVGRGMPIVLLS